MKMSLSEFDELIKSNDGLITFSNCCAIGDSPAGIGHYYVYKPFQYLDEGKEVDFESALRFYNRNIKVAKVINENELAYYEARLKGEMDMGGRGSGSGRTGGAGGTSQNTISWRDKEAEIVNKQVSYRETEKRYYLDSGEFINKNKPVSRISEEGDFDLPSGEILTDVYQGSKGNYYMITKTWKSSSTVGVYESKRAVIKKLNLK